MAEDSSHLRSAAWNTKATSSPPLWECDSGFVGYLGWGGGGSRGERWGAVQMILIKFGRSYKK